MLCINPHRVFESFLTEGEDVKSSIQRNIGPVALLLTGLGSIIGSGWLFGAWKAAKIAGPAAICAWVIGAVVILAIALTYAELGAMFPESGGMVRYARYSHGALVGFISAWANLIAIVSVIPIEAEALIQYMSTWAYPRRRRSFSTIGACTPSIAASTSTNAKAATIVCTKSA